MPRAVICGPRTGTAAEEDAWRAGRPLIWDRTETARAPKTA